MCKDPKSVLTELLADPTNLENVRALTEPDVTYVSLNFENLDLKRVMPWAGTSKGPEGMVQVFHDVARYWDQRELEQTALFGDARYAAMFGRMKYRSTVLGKYVVSPFCLFVEVVEGRCRHVQFMEDTFATTNSFRSGGEWLIRSDPDGTEIAV